MVSTQQLMVEKSRTFEFFDFALGLFVLLTKKLAMVCQYAASVRF